MCARRPGSHPCVSHSGDFVIVTGNGNALSAVTAVLARNQIVAYQLRIEHEGR
jgi:ABC-2 type transport system ATP-binding protein